jgi:hypothetical protein
MTECNVCVEKYNKSNRAKLACPYCAFECCRECCKTWVLGETTARCMNSVCGKVWTRQFLSTAMTQVFMKDDYKKHRENVLFDQERALLPATQPIVESIIKCEKLSEEQNKMRNQIADLYRKITDIDNEKYTIRNGRTVIRNQRSVFIKACPDGECRGFLSSQWKCGLCEKWTCPECNEIKGLSRDGEHVCNPDNVATAKLLGNDTKSCPTCGTGIHKLEGCDQMFCTMCHTGFSWKTGRIETNVHNPHYYEWLRRTGGDRAIRRNPDEIICGQEINHNLVRDITRKMRSCQVPKITMDRLSVIGESIIHIRFVNMERYRQDRVQNNEELRIAYMRNLISEDTFKFEVQKNDKRFQRNTEISNIIQLFVDTVTDIVYRFRDNLTEYATKTETEQTAICQILDEIKPITEYSNDCFRDISKTYYTTRLEINNDLRISSY